MIPDHSKTIRLHLANQKAPAFSLIRKRCACPHCLAAHNAIQERKVARRRLGAARRAVTMIGRAP